jgi:hypothetical protein
LVEWGDDWVWELINLKNINDASSLKLLFFEDFTDRVHNEGLQNGFEDLLITLHCHEILIGLVTCVDRSSCKKSRKV